MIEAAGARDADASDPDAWEIFAQTPSIGAHPARVSELFGGAIDATEAARLSDARRYAARLSELLSRKNALGPVERPSDPADAAIAVASGEELAVLARKAGAVCWADPIAREIRASEVAAFKQALGDDAYESALRNRDEAFSPMDLGIELGGPTPAIDALVASVLDAGRRCLAAWIASQPSGVADRIRLKLAPDDPLPEAEGVYAEAGPAILRRVAA